MKVRKTKSTNSFFQLERRDSIGRWQPLSTPYFVNYATTVIQMKEKVQYYRQRSRQYNYDIYPRLPAGRILRIVKVTQDHTTVTTKERVK
jgi:hypothetical protein